MLAIAVGMAGLAYASVPLYDLFCRVTGFGGTTQQADIAPDLILDKTITVRFDANTNRDLPWEFKPEQNTVTVRIGEQALAYYTATNISNQPITGTSTFNVTPPKAGGYFNKIECFCFERQLIEPGETIRFPVVFFVDPAIVDDKNTREVETITLSYTFFRVEE